MVIVVREATIVVVILAMTNYMDLSDSVSSSVT